MANKQTFTRGALKEAAAILGMPPSTVRYKLLIGDPAAVTTLNEYEKGLAELRRKIKEKVSKIPAS